MEEIKKKISEILNEVKQNPGTLFGLLYPYILVIIIIIGLYYVANVGNIAINKTSAFIPDTTEVTDLAVVQARTVPPVDIFKLKEPAEELVTAGKELYKANCASCHNETGAGGGPAAVGINPAPRNFTSPDGWKNGRTLSAIYTTLEEGIEGSAMISYNFLLPQDRIAIAHYIRQEFMKDAPLDSDADLTALNSIYNLSAGMELPAQIPVSTAMEIVSSENIQKANKLNAALLSIDEDRANYPVQLFEDIVVNEKLALSSLINSETWRSGETAFTDFVTVNVGQNGFSPKINYLSDADRNLLFVYLKQIL